MNWALIALVGCMQFSQFALAKTAIDKPWIFFDLGKTLIDTVNYNPETESFEKEWYMPGSHAYLTELKAKGFRLGLIVNIPEAWGHSYEQKLAKLKLSVESGWNDDPNSPAQAAFDWTMFDKVILPRDDGERKGTGNLSIYLRALEAAAPCAIVYQGESAQEMTEADMAGAVTWHARTEAEEFFLATDRILAYVQERQNGVVCR
jgi:hypothetical protein